MAASDFDIETPYVSFRSNLDEVLDLQTEASEKAVLAAADEIRDHIVNVRLAAGFKGDSDRPPRTEHFTTDLDEDEDRPTATVGLPESAAPERPYFIFWEMSHYNEFSGQREHEPFMHDSMRDSRSKQARAAVRAAEESFRFPGIRSPSKAATGLGLFSVVSLFT